MSDPDFDRIRRYSSAEVTERLNLKPSWLRTWVAEGRVPVHRSGDQRGVWFTYDDVLEIGRRMPRLASRRAGQATGRGHDDERPEPTASDATPDDATDLFSRYAALLPSADALGPAGGPQHLSRSRVHGNRRG